MPPRQRRVQRPDPQPDPFTIPRAPEPAPDPAQPPIEFPEDAHLHEFHRFTRADDRAARDTLLTRAARHGWGSMRSLDWGSLSAISLRSRAEDLCRPHWQRLFSISREACIELSIEFFSTFHMTPVITDYTREDALTFRLGGAERRLSLRQFAVHMGLYRPAELDTPAFLAAISDWPAGLSARAYWTQIGIGPYSSPNIPKSKKLRDPLHRVLHRAIVHSLTARGESPGSVTLADIFYLFCLIEQRPCQLAWCLAKFLFSTRTSRHNQAIYGGGYVTVLADSMGLLPQDQMQELSFAAPPSAIDSAVLTKMDVSGMYEGRLRLLGSDGRPWVQPGAAGQEPVVHMEHGEASGHGHDDEDTHEVHHDDTVHSEVPHSRPMNLFSRDFRGSLPAIRSAIDSLRQGHETTQASVRDTQAMVRDMLELQRLECAHAEAHRAYQSRMLHRLASESILRESTPLEDPPVPPQRLMDFYSGAGTSSAPHMPPPQ